MVYGCEKNEKNDYEKNVTVIKKQVLFFDYNFYFKGVKKLPLGLDLL